jgi:drug/metabolite transporter (DMT)-like permease
MNMSWVIVALLAYFFLAIANLFDKFLVDNVLPSSKAYAFVVCLFGGLLFLGAPWFLQWPGVYWLVINILAGFIFAVAIWMLFEALRRGVAARTLVFIGGMTQDFSISISILFFKEQFSVAQWLGISTLLLGIVIVALLPQPRSFLARLFGKLKLTQDVKSGYLMFAIISALAYATYFVLTKYAYSAQPFASAFIWTRLGAVLFVLLFLLNKRDRLDILKVFFQPKKNKNGSLVVVNQLIGSTGFVLQNYAISLGSVALVNALQGVQYAFLLILSTILAIASPRLLKETFSWRIFLQKTLAVLVIALGLYFILF